MRQIEKGMLQAVNQRKNWKNGNTEVMVCDGGNWVKVYLHNNLIFSNCRESCKSFFTLAGWNTPTTRSRLNALGVGVYQKNFEAYKDGQRLDVCKWYDVQ